MKIYIKEIKGCATCPLLERSMSFSECGHPALIEDDNIIGNVFPHTIWEGCPLKKKDIQITYKLIQKPTCPICGYPTFIKHREYFRRCEGCDWTEK